MDTPTDQQQMLRNALDLLHAALGVLDRAVAPPQIGAHVDLAANQLREAIGDYRARSHSIGIEESLARH